MDSYKDALKQHLSGEGRQDEFAVKIKRTQAAVSRYAAGIRFPDAETARLIDEHSGGAVPFSVWQSEAMRRMGITDPAPASQAEAA